MTNVWVVCIWLLAASFAQQSAQPAASPGQTVPATPPEKTPDANSSGPTPQLSLGESGNIVRLSGPDGSVSVTVSFGGMEKIATAALETYAQTLQLADKGRLRGGSTVTKVDFGKPEYLGRTSSGMTWRVPVRTIDLASGTTQVRQAQAAIGAPPIAVPFEYTVTSKPAAAVQWEVKGASPVWSLSWSSPPERRQFQVLIASQDEPLTNVKLVQSTLHDASGHLLPMGTLHTLDAPGGQPAKRIDVQANVPRSLILQFDPPKGFGPYGTFDGQLRFAADGSGAMKDIEVKVQASSASVRTAGVFLALVGLGLTALISVLRARTARLAALRLALVVAESVQRVRAEAIQACPACRKIAKALADIVAAVSEKGLDDAGLLPPRIVFASAPAPGDTAASLKAHLERNANKVSGIGILVRDGIVVLKEGTATNSAELIAELDAAADATVGPTDAQATVDKILAKRKPPESVRALEARVGRQQSTVKDADESLTVIAAASWGLWAVISLAIAAVWIVSDADYGTPLDLIGSFLWGLGMTGFGAGIQGLTTSSVSTNLNLKLPA